jgi:glutamate decarboxylase
MSNLTRTADYLSSELEKEGFVIMSKKSGEGLPLVAFRFKNETDEDDDEAGERAYDEFSLARSLRSKGWIVPAYTMAPNANTIKMLRVVVREDFTKSMCDWLLHDIRYCLGLLAEMSRETLATHERYIQRHITAHGKARENPAVAAYEVNLPALYTSSMMI